MTKHINPFDILRIFTKNAAKSAADSITTETMLTGGSLAIGNMASAAVNSLNEIKEYSKQSLDALYYFQVKTFIETTDLNQEEVEEFLNKNPNNMRLGMEIFKILEATAQEKQAIFLAKAFKLHVRENINEQKIQEYFHIIRQLDGHTINQIENDLELYSEHLSRGLYGLPNIKDQSTITQFTGLSVPRDYIFQKIGFVSTKPKVLSSDYSGRLKPETIYERTMLYLDFYLDLIRD